MERRKPRQMGEVIWDDDGNINDGNGKLVPATTFFDYKTHPDMVAFYLNGLLAEHGLEIVEYDSGRDDYVFSLVKKDDAHSKGGEHDA